MKPHAVTMVCSNVLFSSQHLYGHRLTGLPASFYLVILSFAQKTWDISPGCQHCNKREIFKNQLQNKKEAQESVGRIEKSEGEKRAYADREGMRHCTILKIGPHTGLRASCQAKQKVQSCPRKEMFSSGQDFGWKQSMWLFPYVRVQLPMGGDSWEVTLPRPALCLTPVYSSRDNESFFPGHWLAGHSRRREALCCGFHKRLTQTEPLSCRISAPVPYVCPPRPSGPPASKPPTTSGC